MIRTAACLCLLASPLAAETYRFGGSWLEWDGERVTYHNGLTSSMHYPADFHRDLTNGFTVRAVIMQGGGLAPDTLVVIPPAGYIAVPESLTLEEHETGHVLVIPEGLS
jgi:hypothetical protein